MLDKIKAAISDGNITQVKNYINSLSLFELNQLDDNKENLLFHAIRSESGNRLEIVNLLLKAGINVFQEASYSGYKNYVHNYVRVSELLAQELDSLLGKNTYKAGGRKLDNLLETENADNVYIKCLLNEAVSYEDAAGTVQILRQIEWARYADMLYGEGIDPDNNNQAMHPSSLGEIGDFGTKNDNGIYLLHDIFSGRVAFGLGYNSTQLKNLFIGGEILSNSGLTSEMSDIVIGRHARYLTEHGIGVNSNGDYNYSYNRADRDIPDTLAESLETLRFDLPKPMLALEIPNEIANEIFVLLKKNDDESELKALIVNYEREKRDEFDEAIKILLNKTPMYPIYKAAICNALNWSRAAPYEEKEEVFYQYYTKPLGKVLNDAGVNELLNIIPLLGEEQTTDTETLKRVTVLTESIRQGHESIIRA